MKQPADLQPVSPLPGPVGLEVLQTLSAYRRDSVGCLLDVRKRYGVVAHLRLSNASPRLMHLLRPLLSELPGELYLLSHPEHIHAIFHGRREHFAKFVQADPGHWAAPLIGDSLQVRMGSEWKERQGLVAPLFRPNALGRVVGLLQPLLLDWIEGWKKAASRDLVADVHSLVLRCAVRYLYGEVSDADRTTLMESLATVHAFLSGTEAVLPLPLWVPVAHNRRFQAATQQLLTLTTRLCQQRRETRSSDPDLLTRLALLQTEAGTPAMTEQQVSWELNSMFLAGHITTCLTLLSTLRFILSAPDVQDRLAEEARRELPEPVPTIGSLERLEFCEQVWKESLRICPPAGVLSRRILSEVTLPELAPTESWQSPVRLSRNASLLVAPWVVQRDPAYFPDPEAFKPDRWTPELRRSLPLYAFFPFGGGERTCIGQSLTRLVMLTLLGTFFRNFRIEAASPAALGTLTTSALGLRQLPALVLSRT